MVNIFLSISLNIFCGGLLKRTVSMRQFTCKENSMPNIGIKQKCLGNVENFGLCLVFQLLLIQQVVRHSASDFFQD